MGAFGAACEEHVHAELNHVLELALGGRVVDGDLGIVDEAEERGMVVVVVANRGGESLRQQEGRCDRGSPTLETLAEGADEGLPM